MSSKLQVLGLRIDIMNYSSSYVVLQNIFPKINTGKVKRLAVYSLNPKPQTLKPKPYNQNPKPYTLNPKP